ncbi:hypothetical protein BpHYR1_026123 [Brachionus plicatilis]|uniref:Uncharacterized protein n=1 Tax=Brachionus plicatilis TaxID=10195 RepID=A0A3M7T762_BRAPC|nr:hypothetical protein BpHYR1_026123 [Brachionus plicatilis]
MACSNWSKQMVVGKSISLDIYPNRHDCAEIKTKNWLKRRIAKKSLEYQNKLTNKILQNCHIENNYYISIKIITYSFEIHSKKPMSRFQMNTSCVCHYTHFYQSFRNSICLDLVDLKIPINLSPYQMKNSVERRASLADPNAAGGKKFGPQSWPAKLKTDGHFGGHTKSAANNFREKEFFSLIWFDCKFRHPSLIFPASFRSKFLAAGLAAKVAVRFKFGRPKSRPKFLAESMAVCTVPSTNEKISK